MTFQQARVIVEIDHDVKFSRFKLGDQEGGVQPADNPAELAQVRELLESALLNLKALSSHS